MKLAFIGLGAMGFPMARHLTKEHEVIVWNRTREKAERHARELTELRPFWLSEATQAGIGWLLRTTDRKALHG